MKNEIIEEEDPFKVITFTPPTDNIPYETLGSGKILFDRVDASGKNNSGFYIIDIDKKKVSGFRLSSGIRQPSISPDGTKIVCLLDKDTSAIYIMNTDGSGCYMVYQTYYIPCYPSWTTDGSKILVFSTSLYGPLYMQSPVKNPTDRVELIKFYYDDDPEWFISPSGGFSMSPGNRLVYAGSAGTGVRGLVSIEPYVGKSGVSVLLQSSEYLRFESPAYSPDGSKIAFLEVDVSLNGWNAVIVKTIDPEGNNLTELVRVTTFNTPVRWGSHWRGMNVSLCWSPDGTKILFTAPTEEYGCHLFVINSDGSGLTQVTDNIQDYDVDVSWGR